MPLVNLTLHYLNRLSLKIYYLICKNNEFWFHVNKQSSLKNKLYLYVINIEMCEQDVHNYVPLYSTLTPLTVSFFKNTLLNIFKL